MLIVQRSKHARVEECHANYFKSSPSHFGMYEGLEYNEMLTFVPTKYEDVSKKIQLILAL